MTENQFSYDYEFLFNIGRGSEFLKLRFILILVFNISWYDGYLSDRHHAMKETKMHHFINVVHLYFFMMATLGFG